MRHESVATLLVVSLCGCFLVFVGDDEVSEGLSPSNDSEWFIADIRGNDEVLGVSKRVKGDAFELVQMRSLTKELDSTPSRHLTNQPI